MFYSVYKKIKVHEEFLNFQLLNFFCYFKTIKITLVEVEIKTN
jgi:hypothetical protein